MTMDVRNELLSQPVVDGAFTRDPFLPSDPKVDLDFSLIYQLRSGPDARWEVQRRCGNPSWVQ